MTQELSDLKDVLCAGAATILAAVLSARLALRHNLRRRLSNAKDDIRIAAIKADNERLRRALGE